MMKTLLVMFAVLALAMPTAAGCPEPGTYTSLSGDVLEGRASESWPGGAEGQMGNSILSMSWDGNALGTQWTLSCPAACTDPVLTLDTVDGNGNGNQTWFTEYCGGSLWLLGGTEAWSTGDADYTADLTHAEVYVTIQFAGGIPVGHVSNIEFTAQFVNCPDGCMAFDITNAAQVGSGPGSSFPPDYPLPAQQPDCLQDAGLLGSYWIVTDNTLVITGCEVAAASSDWGQVKSLYR